MEEKDNLRDEERESILQTQDSVLVLYMKERIVEVVTKRKLSSKPKDSEIGENNLV